MNNDNITNAIDAATAALIESSPWLREAVEREAARSTARTVPADGQEHGQESHDGLSWTSIPGGLTVTRRTAIHDDACTCSAFIHAMPSLAPYGPHEPSTRDHGSGSIRHFPTCTRCGNSAPTTNSLGECGFC